MRESRLLDACDVFQVGVNGGEESRAISTLAFPKSKTMVTYHGLQCHNECRTILLVQEFAAAFPDWYILYFHAKGATHEDDTGLRRNWRACMMRNLVQNWWQCVADLNSGYDAVGCHWMTGEKTPPGQSVFAGNFYWAKSDYLRTIPSIYKRDRIKLSGIDSIESRYEAEVMIGFGNPFPKVKDYHNEWIDQCKA